MAPPASAWAKLDAMGVLDPAQAARHRGSLKAQVADLSTVADQVSRAMQQERVAAEERAALRERAGRCALSHLLPTWEEDRKKREVETRRRVGEILKACLTLVRTIMVHKWAWPFVRPVDPELLGLHDYYNIIKWPMDFSTIKSRLDKGLYTHPAQVLADVTLVFDNARKYNAPKSDVWIMANTMQKLCMEKWNVLVEPKLVLERQRCLAEKEAEKYAEQLAQHRAESAAAERRYAALQRTLTGVDQALATIRNEARFCSGKPRPSAADRKRLDTAMRSMYPAAEEHLSALYAIATEHAPGFKPKLCEDMWVDVEALDAVALNRMLEYLDAVVVGAPGSQDDSGKAGKRKRDKADCGKGKGSGGSDKAKLRKEDKGGDKAKAKGKEPEKGGGEKAKVKVEKGGGDKATGDEAKGAEKGDKGKAKVEKSGGDEAKGGSNKAKPESKEVVEPQKDAKALTKKPDNTNVFLCDCGVRAWREGASLPMVAGACPCSPAPRAAPQSAATGPQPSSGASPQSPSPPCRGCSHSAAQPP